MYILTLSIPRTVCLFACGRHSEPVSYDGVNVVLASCSMENPYLARRFACRVQSITLRLELYPQRLINYDEDLLDSHVSLHANHEVELYGCFVEVNLLPIDPCV